MADYQGAATNCRSPPSGSARREMAAAVVKRQREVGVGERVSAGQGDTRPALVHGSRFGYILWLNRPRLGAVIDAVSEAPPVQAYEVSISGKELG